MECRMQHNPRLSEHPTTTAETSMPAEQPPATPNGMGWLLNNFGDEVAGVAHAIVVSADGLLLATSDDMPADRAEQLSAIAAGLVSLTMGVARYFEGGRVRQTVVDMDAGSLIVMAVSDGSSLVVLAARNADIGHIGYEMALLVERVGKALAPAPRPTLASGAQR
jgi:predicted regulator of Ras-like GTPase activity (Roadblock/LC7/MglB family)